MSLPQALTKPAPNEIEVSLFGRGVGECIVVHGGGGRWIIVDSCFVPESNPRVPAARAYLTEIGVDVTEVVLLVATHWDDDHIGGMAELHAACVTADFVCSAALNRRDLPSFLLEQEQANVQGGSGVDEFREILRALADSGADAPEWGQWNKDLLALDEPFPLDVWALSPSAEAIRRGISMLAHRVHGLAPSGKAVDASPNEGSIVLWVRAGDVCMLLGGDLAEPGSPNRGWSAILGGTPKRWLANGPASLFKVAHHGSSGARHEGIWTDLLSEQTVAVLTTYSRGKNPPPNDEERAWINARADSAWLTMVSSRRRRRDAEVERQIRASGKRLRIPSGFGHVRARTAPGTSKWTIDCFGDSGPLP